MYDYVCIYMYMHRMCIYIYAHVFGVKPQYVTGIPTKMGDWIDHKAEKKVTWRSTMEQTNGSRHLENQWRETENMLVNMACTASEASSPNLPNPSKPYPQALNFNPKTSLPMQIVLPFRCFLVWDLWNPCCCALMRLPPLLLHSSLWGAQSFICCLLATCIDHCFQTGPNTMHTWWPDLAKSTHHLTQTD